jgi:hypothetical protein
LKVRSIGEVSVQSDFRVLPEPKKYLGTPGFAHFSEQLEAAQEKRNLFRPGYFAAEIL